MKAALLVLVSLALFVTVAPVAAAGPPDPNQVCKFFGTGTSITDPVHCFGLCSLGPYGPTCRD
jgi:hypothetical protein